jgi:hypothetical protein
MFKVTGPGGLMAFRQQMMGGGFSAGAPATPGFAGGIYGPDIPPGFVDPVSPRTAPRSRVLPFTGYQTMDTDYLNWLIRARGPQMMAIPGHGIGTFPGWDLPAGWEGNSNVLGPFDTSPLTPPPGVSSPGFFSRLFGGGSGMGGRLINSGLGMLSGLIPGMSGKGASFGSLAGSFLGPLGSIGGGLIGGLFGKLFGGGEGGKTRDARNDFISNFGGLGALQAAAGSAGFNLDKLLNTKKMAEFESEVRKLEEAMGAFDQKVQDANDELDNMESTLDATVKKGEALGYEFDRTGELVSVSFEKMQETASKYGISLDALGPAFQKQRLHEMAGEIINDFELLNLGGTDTGTILAGMSPKIEELVQQSIKFGVEIPKNMQPWIENLIQAGELTDENGVAITDLTQIKFGEPIATEFEKIQGSLKDLIEKIGELVDKITEMGRGVDNATRDRTINIGFNVQDPPDIPTPDYNSLGGFVKNPRYLSGGGWIPRGTDTVPAMLTPGEGVMTRQAVSRLMRGDWPQGGGALTLNVNVEAGDRDDREFGERISREVIRGLKRRGVRLNAA